MTFFRYITYVTCALFLVNSTHVAHGAQPPSDLNKVTIHYGDSLSALLPISIIYPTQIKREKDLIYTDTSVTKLRNNFDPTLCAMTKVSGELFSHFYICVRFSQEKIKRFTAEEGDHYFLEYTPNQKGCYIGVWKENIYNKKKSCKIDTFTLLLTK